MKIIVRLDRKIIYWIQRHRNKIFDKIFAFITYLGDNGFIWLLYAIFFIMFGHGYTGETMITGLAISTIFCLVLVKRFAKRKRPCDLDQDHVLTIRRPSGHSFPSAHSSAAFSVAGVIYFMAPAFALPAIIIAILIAFSRVYLFVHYPSDVVAGCVMGISFASLAVLVVERVLAL